MSHRLPEITHFFNIERPNVGWTSNQEEGVVKITFPDRQAMTEEDRKELFGSFRVTSNDYVKAARSARTWENLLEIYRHPFLLLRVADMRWTLGASTSALELYNELYQVVKHPALKTWIDRVQQVISSQASQSLHAYKYTQAANFAEGQRWRSTAVHDPAIPAYALPPQMLEALRQRWADIQAVEGLSDKYMNYHCLQTNFLEGTVNFDYSATLRLVDAGFFGETLLLTDTNILGGEIRNCLDAICVLQDSHKALLEAFEFFTTESPTLDATVLCRLHRTLMDTNRVVYQRIGPQDGQPKFRYSHIGMTRRRSKVNVTAHMPHSRMSQIQYCPYDKVDEELAQFYPRFNELIRRDDVDPIAAASWIQHVFVTIHPFEDGNGRLSRILASVPLIRQQLPPLCIGVNFKQPYIRVLNHLRELRTTEAYKDLMLTMYDATISSLDSVKAM